jgi:hypothetical protein
MNTNFTTSRKAPRRPLREYYDLSSIEISPGYKIIIVLYHRKKGKKKSTRTTDISWCQTDLKAYCLHSNETMDRLTKPLDCCWTWRWLTEKLTSRLQGYSTSSCTSNNTHTHNPNNETVMKPTDTGVMINYTPKENTRDESFRKKAINDHSTYIRTIRRLGRSFTT